MAEGKTIDGPSVKCESCEESDSSKFCIDCNQPLCTKCTQFHARLAPTKHHKPIPIEEYKLLTSKPNKHSQGSQCAKHPGKPIEKLCDDCLVVLCSDCENDHKGHTIHKGSLDANFLHLLSAQKIPGLLEIIQQLRDFETGSPKKITLYKEAEKYVTSWKSQLLNIISKEADELLKVLRDEIKKQETLQGETSSQVKEYIVIVDQQITKLSESRKISDTNKLLNKLSSCDKNIQDFKVYINNVKSSQEKHKLDDILPFKDEFYKTVKLVKKLFSRSPCNVDTLVTYPRVMLGENRKQKPTNLRADKKLRLIYKKSLKGRRIRLCGTYMYKPKQIVTFERCSTQCTIKTFNFYLDNTGSYFRVGKNLNLISIAPNRYAAIVYNPSEVYLLGESFSDVTYIFGGRDGYVPCGLFAIKEYMFMVLEKNENKGSIRFKEVSMKEDDVDINILCEVQNTNTEDLMAYYNKGVITFADTSKSLSTIDIRTGESTRIHETEKVIRSICTDGNRIFFGDDGGTIHKIEDNTYRGKLQEGLKSVTGLLQTESGLVVLANDELQIYQ